MQIVSTRFTPQAKTAPAAQPPAGESTTFTNEPHIPMDAVNRGYADLFENVDAKKIKDVVGFAALGAAGGALAGTFSNGAMMIPAQAVTSAGVDMAGVYIDSQITGDPWGGLATTFAPMIGGVAGAIGGGVSFGLQAFTGMGPVASGAIAGGLTHLAIAVASER